MHQNIIVIQMLSSVLYTVALNKSKAGNMTYKPYLVQA